MQDQQKNTGNVLFISGIDTDTGKSIITGALARHLQDSGVDTVTQKMVQTGCSTPAEDIVTHRKIMGTGLTAEDNAGRTCSQIFAHPASPHLAAAMENKEVQLQQITEDTRWLQNRHRCILLEGAGGLMVPLNNTTTTLDYIGQQQYPLLLVTSSKLGSINHTLLSLEVCKMRNIRLAGVVYNAFPATDRHILNDSVEVIIRYTQQYYPSAPVLTFPLAPEHPNWQALNRQVGWHRLCIEEAS